MEDGGNDGPSPFSCADTHSPRSDASSTNNSRRYSSSHHAPKLINRVRITELQPPLHFELPWPPMQLHEHLT
jgi:hypothetical protein